MAFHAGGELDQKSTAVVRSALKLHQHDWIWVDTADQADIWLVDPSVCTDPVSSIGRKGPAVIIVAQQLPATIPADKPFLLAPPIRGARLLKLLDQIVATLEERRNDRQTTVDTKPASAPPNNDADQSDSTPPWIGQNIMLVGKANLARFPVTAELSVWLEAMAKGPVSFNAMAEDLSMDRELLDTVLNAAAGNGNLVDEHGFTFKPYKKGVAGCWGKSSAAAATNKAVSWFSPLPPRRHHATTASPD